MGRTDLSRHDDFLDSLLGVPALHGARLSPDGRQIAWLWSGLGPTAQAWIAPIDGSRSPRALVEDARRDCDYLVWARDGNSLIVGQSQDGAERISLLQVFLDGRPARRLTPEGADHYTRGGQLLSDNRTLIFAANRDPRSGAGTEAFLVQSRDIESGAERLIARPERPTFAWILISPDERRVLYPRSDRDPAGQQLWLAEIDGRSDREIVDLGAARKVDGEWTATGDAVILIGESADRRCLGLWHLADGRIDWLIDDPARNIERAFQPKRSDRIVVIEERAARSMAYLLDPAHPALIPFPAKMAGTTIPLGLTPDGAWIAGHFSARHPYRLLRLGAPGDAPSVILSHPAKSEIPPEALAAPQDYRWKSADGLEIQGWLYRAKGEVLGTILLIHGGPTYHDSEAFDTEVQYYVRCGFNVLQPNYRGSTGFSLSYQEAIKKEGWGGAEQEDIRAGALALIRDGIARPGRIGITGTSYGGYSSWWAITHFPTEIVAAAAPICGMTDLVVDYETTRPDLRPYSEEMMGGSPATAPERYRERSPIHYADRIRGRLLIVQGANDPNVTPENVTAMRRELDRAGIAHEILTFADEGHGIAKPENRRLLYRRLAEFFAEAFES